MTYQSANERVRLHINRPIAMEKRAHRDSDRQIKPARDRAEREYGHAYMLQERGQCFRDSAEVDHESGEGLSHDERSVLNLRDAPNVCHPCT
jgi:hypothetical protein